MKNNTEKYWILKKKLPKNVMKKRNFEKNKTEKAH